MVQNLFKSPTAKRVEQRCYEMLRKKPAFGINVDSRNAQCFVLPNFRLSIEPHKERPVNIMDT